jgi:hypothetical protein
MAPEHKLIVVERAPTTALAERLQSLLAAQGIDAFLDPYTAEEVVSGELYREFTGVDVCVRVADAERACKLVEEAHRAGEVLKALYDRKEARESEGA